MKDGVPIGLGYFAVSFTFGMMANFNVAQAILLLVAILAYIKIRVKD